MRRNINRMVALAIGISVMSGSIMPVFAADTQSTPTVNVQTNQKPVLTLDDAIKSAISISDTLVLDEQKIAYQDKINDLNKKQDDFNKVTDELEKYDDDTSDANLNQAKQQSDFDEDSVIQKVIDQYNNIVTSQMQIDMATKNLAVENTQLDNAKFKQSIGAETSIDIKTLQLQIQKDQNTLNTNINKLNDAEYTFKVLIGKDVNQYTLVKDIKFEQFKIDGSIDDYLDNIINSDLKYTEQLLNISKDYYNGKDYESDNKITIDDLNTAKGLAEEAQQDKSTLSEPSSDGNDLNAYQKYEDSLSKDSGKINAYTSLLTKRLSFLNSRLNNYKTENTITETKKTLKDQLKSYYTNLKTYEDNINYCKNQIELNNEILSNYKLKYDLGMITETVYDAQAVSTEQTDIDLRNAIISYNQNKEYIQKPWIASASSSSSSSSQSSKSKSS